MPKAKWKNKLYTYLIWKKRSAFGENDLFDRAWQS